MAHPVITRFAPSPTGHLHIGGARTALFCWAAAQRAKRRGDPAAFLLRIEDTDAARSSEDAARGILEDLSWLGINWDEGPRAHGCGGDPRGIGPFHQSDRRDVYDAKLQSLLERGLAFPAFETPEQLASMRREAEAQKRSVIYRRPDTYDHAAALDRAKTDPHVIRFRMPAEPVTVRDEVLGEVTFPHDELDDFVLRKADGMPTYHFAVVVDDALMGVTHVLRGQEHLNNSPKHVALQRALGLPTPVYAHMPLIFNTDGTKMSKRDKDKAAKKALRDTAKQGTPPAVEAFRAELDTAAAPGAFDSWLKDKAKQLTRNDLARLATAMDLQLPEIDVEDFRAAGYLPAVICNFLALLGWNPKAKNEDGTDLERFDTDYLAEHFDLTGIGKTSAKFDRDKLLAFNADTIQHAMTDRAFADEWLAWSRRFDTALAAWAEADPDRWLLAARAARPRAKTLGDAKHAIAYAFIDPAAIAYQPKGVRKFLLKGDPPGIEVLSRLREALAACEPWTVDAIDRTLAAAAEQAGGMGPVAQPVRVALTGAPVSPPPGETLALLTKDDAIARIDRCLAHDHTGAGA